MLKKMFYNELYLNIILKRLWNINIKIKYRFGYVGLKLCLKKFFFLNQFSY